MEEISHNLVHGNNLTKGQARRMLSNPHASSVRIKFIADAKRFVYLILAASAIGQGARMLYQGILAPGTSYIPSGIDLAFDWGILLTLGMFVLINELVKLHRGATA